ncbi:acid protease [Peniophora sp. CONT]|nr:acid protease [Peniophora sp. CONT]
MWRSLPLCLVLCLCLPSPGRARTTAATALALRRKRAVEDLLPINGGTSSVLTAQAEGALFTTQITLGGVVFNVDVDTGSSDLWIIPKAAFTDATHTEVPASVVYGTGSINGTVAYAPLTLGSLNTEKQAFIQVTEATDMSGLLRFGSEGILGLGFLTSTTGVNRALSTAGFPIASSSAIQTLLSSNPSLPRMFTVLLGRDPGTGHGTDGLLTIGDYIAGRENVVERPRLSRFVPAGQKFADSPRWTVLAESVIVNGQTIGLHSAFPDAPAGTNVALLDTGTTLSAVPRAVADAVYGAVPGAYAAESLTSEGSHDWVVPCSKPVQVSITFGGKEIPIHPLDTTKLRKATSPRGIYCTGTLQTAGPTLQEAGIDMLLGDSFLLNVYSAYHFGRSSLDGVTEEETPYFQLTPLTDPSASLSEFEKIRMKEIRELGLPELSRAQILGEQEVDVEGKEEVSGVIPVPAPIDDLEMSPAPVDDWADSEPGIQPPIPPLDSNSREDASIPLHALPPVAIAGLFVLGVVVGVVLIVVNRRRKRADYEPLSTEEYALRPRRLD